MGLWRALICLCLVIVTTTACRDSVARVLVFHSSFLCDDGDSQSGISLWQVRTTMSWAMHHMEKAEKVKIQISI